MKIRFWPVMPIMAVAFLSGCATNPASSFVANSIRAVDANKIASDTVDYLSDELPPARTTLVIEPPQNSDVVTPVMLDKLRARGYGVTTYVPKSGTIPPVGTPFRYAVSPLDNGVWLRLNYSGKEASRYYMRTTTGLISNSPFTVRGGVNNER